VNAAILEGLVAALANIDEFIDDQDLADPAGRQASP
jgi:hypothetical protein